MNPALHNRAFAFLQGLENLCATDLRDAFVNEAIETNGYLTAPKHDQSHFWELSLHGIDTTGSSDEEAIANWKRLACANLGANL